MFHPSISIVLCLLCIATSNAQAPRPLNIILTNDDGFETPLIQALFNELVAAGHNVVMSAPYEGQSGTAAKIDFLAPITNTTRASPKGTIPAGSLGIGNTTLKPNQFYVNGAVTGAALYGIDVLGPMFFGAGKIDLLLSGPNEGQNVGLFSPHSGTVGAVVTTLNRGNVPAIACSADSSEPNPTLIGKLMVKFIGALNRTSTGGLSFRGAGLNLNFPRLSPSTTVDDYSFFGTTTGIATNSVGLRFVARLSDCPFAVARGVNVPLPGLCLDAPYTASGYPLDTNPLSEGNLIQNGQRSIAVSVIEGTYQADAAITQTVLNSIPFTTINGPKSCRATFDLFNATSNTKFGTFSAGSTIMNPPCSMNFEIVNTTCTVVGPMKITTFRDGNAIVNSRTENNAPYFAFGDDGKGDVFGAVLPLNKTYTLSYEFNGAVRGPISFTISGNCK
jgi:5'-nucleotidase